MRAPEFEAMIRPAKLYPELWRLLLGLLLIALVFFGTVSAQLVMLFAALGPFEFGSMLTRLKQPTEAGPTLMLLSTFVGLLLGSILAVTACHGRSPGTLFGPRDETLRDFALVIAVTVPIYAGLFVVGGLLEPAVPNLAWEVWLKWLPFALPLILIQVTAEEALFRGYLPQQLAARFRARAVWMYLPAVLFAALHWTPAAGATVWLTLLATFVFALIAADLTERTGSLGAAIGFHFVNNVFGLTIVSVAGSLTGLSRWTTAFTMEDTDQVSFSLGVNIIFLAVVWRVLRWVLIR